MNSDQYQQLLREKVQFLDKVSSNGFTLGLDFVGGVPTQIVSTWDESWLAEYQKNDYILHDPVVVWGTSNEGMATWEELHPTFASQPVDVIGIARRRGMLHGSVFSITVNRRRTILGISHDKPSLPVDVQDEIISLLSVLTFRCPNRNQQKLSMKSREYLQMAARGLTDKEVAEANSVTPGAVHQLRHRTLAKLGVATVPQAILVAYKSRLID